jgi:hypothetical protein
MERPLYGRVEERASRSQASDRQLRVIAGHRDVEFVDRVRALGDDEESPCSLNQHASEDRELAFDDGVGRQDLCDAEAE